MHNLLCQIPRELQLCEQIIGSPQLPGQIQLLQFLLLGQDSVNLGCQDLVFFLLSVEELGSLGGVVDDFRDLDSWLSSESALGRHIRGDLDAQVTDQLLPVLLLSRRAQGAST